MCVCVCSHVCLCVLYPATDQITVGTLTNHFLKVIFWTEDASMKC